MSKVAIIGFGNLGYHLAVNISKKHDVTVFGRTGEDELIKPLSSFDPSLYDFAILAIPDGAVKEVSDTIESSDCIILHTSGFRPLSDLSKHPRCGVMYPLQTFTKEKKIDFNSFPIFIEGNDESDKELFSFVRSFSNDARFMSSGNRAKLHLAAVFACNFTNHMYQICDDILKPMELSFSEIHFLSQETLDKAVELGPFDAQTGPGIRGDFGTIASHISMLSDESRKQIYELITDDIRKSHQ